VHQPVREGDRVGRTVHVAAAQDTRRVELPARRLRLRHVVLCHDLHQTGQRLHQRRRPDRHVDLGIGIGATVVGIDVDAAAAAGPGRGIGIRLTQSVHLYIIGRNDALAGRGDLGLGLARSPCLGR